jgi:Tfp pilus assembly protein FimV
VVRADKKATPGTVPGAAATLNVAISESTKENEMEMKELQEAVATLQTQNETLAASNARLNQALALRDARDMARETLSQISLPDATKARVVETLAKNPPMKDGALDREAFATSILEAVKTESAYLEKVVGLGNIRGLGESANDDQELDEDKLEGELAESFRAIGLSEAGAKIAAKGRV